MRGERADDPLLGPGWVGRSFLWSSVSEILNFKFKLMQLLSRNDFIDSTLVGCSELGYWCWMIYSSLLTSKLFDLFLVESASYLKNFISAAHIYHHLAI